MRPGSMRPITCIHRFPLVDGVISDVCSACGYQDPCGPLRMPVAPPIPPPCEPGHVDGTPDPRTP